MRFGLLTLLCCASVTALPPREDSLEGEAKHPHGGTVNVIKEVDGGVGGGAGVVGIGGGSGGGGGCDPVACDIKVGYIYGYPKRLQHINTNIRDHKVSKNWSIRSL